MTFVEKEGATPGFWECNECGQREVQRWEFSAEWSRLKAEGWVATKINGEWHHRCDECSAKAHKTADEILNRQFRSVS
jgi:hypothetical protein